MTRGFFIVNSFVIPFFIITFACVMQWTDRIRQVKIALVVAAVIISVVSLLISNFLVKDLQKEERVRMEIWAQALRSLNTADEDTDLTLVLSVLEGNKNITVIFLNKQGEIYDFRNIEDSSSVSTYVKTMKSKGDTIVVDDQLVCYDDSLMLKRLSAWPYVQLGIVFILVVVALFALLASKKAEQNKVWVGLSKETAHQLGTPISSLMAWVELLKENYPGDELIPEMDKDVKRLELVAERFSKIGSLPELVDGSLNEVLKRVTDYMDRRTSKKVDISFNLPVDEVIVKMNKALIEWVVENLCKNAVDAMEGDGKIELLLFEEEDRAIVEVKDNGKGIKKKDQKNVFTPGFTTKKRGWGLGLSLAKRIVEEYHKGKIFVEYSEPGVGTTFRIELSK